MLIDPGTTTSRVCRIGWGTGAIAKTSAYQIALIGYGYAARTFHVPLVGATPGLRIAVVSSRQPEKVQADLPDVDIVASPEAAMERADVDLVLVASPNDTHARLALAALDRGKHVIVEKPFTLTMAEARAVAARASAVGRRLTVFHNRRWDSDFLGARDVMQRGVLGALSQFESHFDRFRPAVRDRWRERAGPGAGLWFDLGPHLVDQSLQLFGIPDGVRASFARQRPGAETEDWAHVVLEYGACRAVLHASLLVAGPPIRMLLHGAAGSWMKEGLDVQEKQLLAGVRPGAEGWGRDPIAATRYDGASGDRMSEHVPDGDYRQFYLALRRALDGAGEVPVTPAQAVAVMAVVLAAIDSARTGARVSPDLTGAERAAFARETPPTKLKTEN